MTVRDRLESRFGTHRIVSQLHDVPPHEVYEVIVDGRRAIYKGDTASRGSAGVEGRVVDFVGDRTSVPAPEVLAVGDDYFVAAWDPNAPAPDDGQVADETWASAAGRGLAMLHRETAPSVNSYGRFRPAGSGIEVDAKDDWHAAAVAYVDHHRPVLARHGHADVADDVVDFLTEHQDAFAGADGPVCCHGWATPDHVAVADGRVACMVDFEHAIAAPGEFDYWRTVLPTFGADGTADVAKRAFRAGYDSVRPLPSGFERRAPLYLLLNQVYYFESLYVQDQHGPDATAERAARLRDGVRETLAGLGSGQGGWTEADRK